MNPTLAATIRFLAPQYIAFCYRSGCWANRLYQAACLRQAELD